MRISYGTVNQVGIYQGSGFHYELLDFIIDVLYVKCHLGPRGLAGYLVEHSMILL